MSVFERASIVMQTLTTACVTFWPPQYGELHTGETVAFRVCLLATWTNGRTATITTAYLSLLAVRPSRLRASLGLSSHISLYYQLYSSQAGQHVGMASSRGRGFGLGPPVNPGRKRNVYHFFQDHRRYKFSTTYKFSHDISGMSSNGKHKHRLVW